MRLLSILLLTINFLSVTAFAELKAKNIAIIANSNDRDSIEIANYYAERRRVPTNNIIKLPLSSSEGISRSHYEKSLLNPLREELKRRNISADIKAFLSIKGVPLKIAEAKNNPSELEGISLAKEKLASSTKRIQTTVAEIQKIAGETQDGFSNVKDNEFLAKFNDLIKRAGKVVKKTKTQADDELLAKNMQKMGGLNTIISIMAPSGEGKALEDSKNKLEKFKLEAKKSFEILFGLQRVPNKKNRERMYLVSERTVGLIGVRALAMRELNKSTLKETSASVDSELSMLWWDRSSYPLSGRLPNPLYFKLKGKQMHLPVLMPSRLDGASKEKILSIIDETLETETNGVEGNVYIDTRGLKAKSNNTFYKFDKSLNDLGWLIRKKSNYKVYMDTSPQLFDSAENVALYAGWYRLRDYQDVFKFKPGAIAWHIASEEAVSLRGDKEKGWCKNFIERGVAATIGAVQEPFLESFPDPLAFFGLLLTGEYTLAEAYFLTLPNISWRTVLLGDPLYNPWKGRGFVEIKDLKMKNLQNQEIDSLLESPSEKKFQDPVQIKKKIKEENKKINKELEKIFI